MKKITVKKIMCVMGLFMLTPVAMADDAYAVTGTAFNLKTGKVAYRELFTALDGNNEVHVNYAKPDGVIFARKKLNYNTEVFQPGLEFNDERDDELVSAAFDGGRLLLTHKIKGDSQTKTLYETSKLIIDAGVDAFIQQQWARITSGKKVEFDVADARHLGIEKFVIREIDSSASPLAYKGSGEKWKYFRVETANKLSSIFVEPIYYAYEPDGKYLMRYQGLSNIDNDSGDAWDVRIEYEYFN